jgi:hypothetical protein
MNKQLIRKQRDADGRTRFYVLPIETEAGFRDLVKFVKEEYGCEFGVLDEGPGTLVQKGSIGGAHFTFVLSDSTGTQFFAESEENVGVAELIADGVETRLRETMG